eukprot:TRINITY_DN6553_c0_g1_i1.p1 TRINITY_DN6553_c0_g1~~TRINITY_DN6553_c0_g1_i1.p1  ORF type:complete len:1003 (+),score=295.30 TRINITY_DN6553_c0_g1_i1:123-3011(+)
MAGNKFWGGESSSESDSDSSSSEDEKPTVAAAAAPRKQMARWAEESSSDEEVEKKRTVLSSSDKRFELMNAKLKELKNHVKIDDFASIITDYEALLKMLEKLKTAVAEDGGPPAQFVKAISDLEDYVEKTHADLQEKKQNKGEKLTENKAKAFNTLRAKVRKQNKQFQESIEQYKANPEDFAAVEQEASASSGSEAEESGSSSSSSSGSSGSSSDSDSSSSDSDSSSDSGSGSDSDSDSDSDSSAADGDGDADAVREKKMARWLIDPEKLKAREEKAAKDKEKEEEQKKKDLEKRAARRKDEGADKKASKSEKKSEKEPEEYSPDELMKKVTEIAQQRGRRGFDRKDYYAKLTKLMAHALKQGPNAQLYIYSSMVSADFDSTGSAFAAMRIDLWNEALSKVNKMLPLLEASYEEIKANNDGKVVKDDDNEDPRSHFRQQELFVAFVEKLDDELYKALQFTVDVYGAEYQEILCNSSKFLVLVKRTLKFFEATEQKDPLGSLALRMMEQLYYKHDNLNRAVYQAIRNSVQEQKPAEGEPEVANDADDWVWPEDSKEYMAKLCRQVLELGNLRMKRKACLVQAYHLALHDCFQPARDMLHLGQLQEQSMESDVSIQILYNRVIAQMGLCAFRLGKMQEAHNCLMDVCQYNKVRELLAQGLSYSKHMERTPEQERAERQRQLPYHMHINLEVLESAHHICAMLLEVPNMALQSMDPTQKRVISRVLRRALDQCDKQMYSGPPENAKEAVVAAAKALQRGDWLSAFTCLEDLKLWEHIDSGRPENGAKVKEMIKEKVKTEALRTYLFAYSSIYDAFHLDQLVEMFGLDAKTIHSMISKMMIKEELAAFWDESSKFVLVQHIEPSNLQRLALTLADRSAQAVENNERLVDQKSGGYAFKEARSGPAGARFEDGGKGRRFGKGDGKGKGKGKSKAPRQPAQMRGWENARAGALRGGGGQRGWSTGTKP